MPAWSPEIANLFIRLGAKENRTFDQMQLQKLVYIAHGWCLAIKGEPLTGDRPEAWVFGPVYRRLADALASYGKQPVKTEIGAKFIYPNLTAAHAAAAIKSDLEDVPGDLIARIYTEYGRFKASQLSTLTRRGSTPWKEIFADGNGQFRDIPHRLIKAHFVRLSRPGDNPDHP